MNENETPSTNENETKPELEAVMPPNPPPPLVAAMVPREQAPPAPPTPSIGRIVHYIDPSTRTHRAAIITRVVDLDEHHKRGEKRNLRTGTYVDLELFGSPKSFIADAALDDAGEAAGSWHWPEKV